MARYVMTARRKAALRRAQLASARRRRKGMSRKTKRRVAGAVAVGAAAVAYDLSRHRKNRFYSERNKKAATHRATAKKAKSLKRKYKGFGHKRNQRSHTAAANSLSHSAIIRGVGRMQTRRNSRKYGARSVMRYYA